MVGSDGVGNENQNRMRSKGQEAITFRFIWFVFVSVVYSFNESNYVVG